MGRPRKIQEAPAAVETGSPAQQLASRIWGNQSVSLSRKERIRRIQAALAGHGYTEDDIKAIVFPA